MNEEVWKEIAEFPGYRINDLGHIESNKRGNTWKRRKPAISKNRIVTVNLRQAGINLTCRVANIVALTFLGECPDHHTLHFYDGDSSNVQVDNLAYVPFTQVLVEWKEMPGYPGYWVSDTGIVYDNRPGPFKIPERKAGSPDTEGYLKVYLRNDGQKKGKYFRIHILVLRSFRGPCPPGMHACHRNDRNQDNRIENLYWGTPSQNQLDRFRNGGKPHYGKPVVDMNLIRKVKTRYEADPKASYRKLSKEFGVSRSTIGKILNNGHKKLGKAQQLTFLS